MTYLKGSPFGCDEFESYQIKVGSISNDCVFVRKTHGDAGRVSWEDKEAACPPGWGLGNPRKPIHSSDTDD